MKTFTEYIGSQFGNPRGIVGKICCLLMNYINKPMYDRVAAQLMLNGKSKVLDIGYGNGYLIKKIYKAYKAEIYGIDISPDMKTVAAKKNRKAIALKKVTLAVGDCCNLQFNDNTFCAIVSVNTIYFWEDTLKGLREILRTLKEGGVFYNVVYSKEWLQRLSYTKTGFRFFEKEDYVALGKQAGFSEVTVTDIAKGKSYSVAYRK